MDKWDRWELTAEKMMTIGPPQKAHQHLIDNVFNKGMCSFEHLLMQAEVYERTWNQMVTAGLIKETA